MLFLLFWYVVKHILSIYFIYLFSKNCCKNTKDMHQFKDQLYAKLVPRSLSQPFLLARQSQLWSGPFEHPTNPPDTSGNWNPHILCARVYAYSSSCTIWNLSSMVCLCCSRGTQTFLKSRICLILKIHALFLPAKTKSQIQMYFCRRQQKREKLIYC